METKIIFFTTLFSLIGISYFKPHTVDLKDDKSSLDLRDAEDYLDSLRAENKHYIDTICGTYTYDENLIDTYE
jgi:hypothetical protein